MHFAFMDQFGSNEFITDFSRISFLQVFTDGGCEKFHPADTQMMPMAHNKPRQEKFLELVYVIFEALSVVFRPRRRIHEIF